MRRSEDLPRDARPSRPKGQNLSARGLVDPGIIARRLGAAVQWPGSASVSERRWRLIVQNCYFDAWLIAWPGETGADLHDHGGSRGALHVVSGSLVETVPWRDERGSVTLALRQVQPGATLAFGARHVHDVRNEEAAPALSLHVYSPPLTSMVYYDRFGDRLLARDKGWAMSADGASIKHSVLRPVAP